MATPQSSPDRKAALQKQIEALQKQMQEIDQEAVHNLKLKLSDARRVVRDLEVELAKLVGEPPAAEPEARRSRRATITDEALEEQLLKTMADHGQAGMNAKQIADKMNLDPIRVRKFIKDHPNVLSRRGAGPGTKFYLSSEA